MAPKIGSQYFHGYNGNWKELIQTELDKEIKKKNTQFKF